MRQVRGNEIAMIFQEPMTSLNPVFTIGDQIVEAIRTPSRYRQAPRRAAAWSSCSTRSAFPMPAAASTTIRTDCPAACASG